MDTFLIIKQKKRVVNERERKGHIVRSVQN